MRFEHSDADDKLVDEFSPVLAAACATGLHMHDAQVVVAARHDSTRSSY